MMKKLTTIALVSLSMAAKAENMRPMNYEETNVFEKVAKPVRPVTDAIMEELTDYLQRNITIQGQPLKKDARTRDKQTLRVTRSVKDCIKPGGLIDDEVQMCVNGTREKNW